MEDLTINKIEPGPLVSIIIPVFNGQLFIRDAYRLLIDQKLDDFEIIFVDNNSTDSSVEIINDIIKTDDRVRLYHELMQGAASARNTGLRYAKGEFIYFFDVDDELFDNALITLLDVLINNDSLDSVHGNTVKSNLKLKDIKIDNSDTNKLTIPEHYYWGIRWMTYSTLPGTPSFLHRKHVFDKIGCFDVKLRLGEDAAFHVKLGMECKVAHLDKNILLYFRHQQSTVSNQNKKQEKVFTYWKPLIHSHIPYLLTHDVPLDFRKQVLVRVYGSIPHMLFLTKGYAQKKQLKNKLFREIKPLRIPVFLRPFINIVMLSGNGNVYKVYAYFVLRYYMKYAVK
ncbi:glycosyltransferase family 2 protein [Gelidibacter maritimus]|uniref:Glycosyltransferase family 2 protein n=1 Tax=Gelidibacter maritimus TaxID=2761487 RepID=A0A7W2M4T5_9FLAO|nr:glycosyltransferase family 2 protein [Gelidibacter maritimus]MBA6152688.1 glycosyltransferase family 2 protein [Gelidibacter maritimus]